LIKIRKNNKNYFSILNLRILSGSFIKTLRQKYLVFLFFVALSTLAWYIRALGDFYIAEVRYPVEYTNLPPNRRMSKVTPDNLIFHVRADGFTILSYKLKIKKPLHIDVSNILAYSDPYDSTSLFLLTKYLREMLTAELNETNKNLKILDISPDTLIIKITNLKKKLLPALLRMNESKTLYFSRYIINSNPYTKLASASNTGLSLKVDPLRCIHPQFPDFQNLTDIPEKNVQHQKVNMALACSND
jgi:hypothetical protein